MSLSALTSSVASPNYSMVTDKKYVADNIAKSLQLLGSCELQSEAFQLAMHNPVFKQLFENIITNQLKCAMVYKHQQTVR